MTHLIRAQNFLIYSTVDWENFSESKPLPFEHSEIIFWVELHLISCWKEKKNKLNFSIDNKDCANEQGQLPTWSLSYEVWATCGQLYWMSNTSLFLGFIYLWKIYHQIIRMGGKIRKKMKKKFKLFRCFVCENSLMRRRTMNVILISQSLWVYLRFSRF